MEEEKEEEEEQEVETYTIPERKQYEALCRGDPEALAVNHYSTLKLAIATLLFSSSTTIRLHKKLYVGNYKALGSAMGN